MKKYLDKLREIDSNVFDAMGKTSQITIDTVQDIIAQLDRDTEEEPIQRDELGAINYDINILLEVFYPELEYDIAILQLVDEVIADWYNDVDFINVSLGIPRNEG